MTIALLICIGVTMAVVDCYCVIYEGRIDLNYFEYLAFVVIVDVIYLVGLSELLNIGTLVRLVITFGMTAVFPSLLQLIAQEYLGMKKERSILTIINKIGSQLIFFIILFEIMQNTGAGYLVESTSVLDYLMNHPIFFMPIVLALLITGETAWQIGKTWKAANAGLYFLLNILVFQFIISLISLVDDPLVAPIVYSLSAADLYFIKHFFGVYGADYCGPAIVKQETTGNILVDRKIRLIQADNQARLFFPELKKNSQDQGKKILQIFPEMSEWMERIEEGEKNVSEILQKRNKSYRVSGEKISLETGRSVYRFQFQDETEVQIQKHLRDQERKRAEIYKQQLASRFEEYMDPTVMKAMLEDESGKYAEGKEQRITVLFADIHGFTNLCENKQPKEIVEILNKSLSAMTACVIQNRGMIDKFIGDCIMALWNVTDEQENANYLACKTAMDMRSAFRDLNVELQENYGVTITLGTGIASGDAVVGNIGADVRHQFSAIGDVVNVASRLQGVAGVDEILITESVANEVAGMAEVEPLRSMELKGHHQKIMAWRLNSVGGRS